MVVHHANDVRALAAFTHTRSHGNVQYISVRTFISALDIGLLDLVGSHGDVYGLLDMLSIVVF